MTIYTNVNEFCSAVMAHKGADPSMISVEARKPRSPSPTWPAPWAAWNIHLRPQVWCIAHHPEWDSMPEEEELVQTGEYWMYPFPKTCPLRTIQSINIGDEVNIPIRTCVGVRGVLKRPAYRGYYRRGIVIREPHVMDQDFDDKDGWHCMNIEWSSTIITKDKCNYKNAPFKALTIQ